MDTQDNPWAARALSNIDATRHGKDLSDYKPSLTTDGEEKKPSKAIEAVVYEFGIRWPCPRDVDPDRYDMRLRDLMRLCAGMAPGLLRKAGDRIAVIKGRIFTLPSASELHEAADSILQERAAMQMAQAEFENPVQHSYATPYDETDPNLPTIARRARSYNLDNMRKGSPLRWTDGMELFSLEAPGEKRRCQGDGTVAW